MKNVHGQVHDGTKKELIMNPDRFTIRTRVRTNKIAVWEAATMNYI